MCEATFTGQIGHVEFTAKCYWAGVHAKERPHRGVLIRQENTADIVWTDKEPKND